MLVDAPAFPNMASKKTTLPWKIAPKSPELIEVGHADYGVIEIPKLGALKVNEAVFIQQETKDCPSVQRIASDLAFAIEKQEGLNRDEALAALFRQGEGEGVDSRFFRYLIDFQERIAATTPVRNTVLATAMLRRIMGEEWTVQQTGDEIPVKLVNDLAEFCSKEMNGWVETEAEPESEESVVEQVKND